MFKKILNCAVLVTLAITAPIVVEAADTPKTEKEKFSYAIGFQVGRSLKRDNITDVDVKSISQAISDVLTDAKLKISTEEMQAAIAAQQKKMLAARNAKGEKAKKAGDEFLAKNKKAKGVKTLASGVQYKVLKAGKGKKLEKTDTFEAHYEGSLLDGSVFDSSYKRDKPATFSLDGVIKGWQEILPMMKVGDKWKVWIPSDLAYGSRGAGNAIGPGETLVFDIELIKTKDKEAKESAKK